MGQSTQQSQDGGAETQNGFQGASGDSASLLALLQKDVLWGLFWGGWGRMQRSRHFSFPLGSFGCVSLSVVSKVADLLSG